MCPGVDFSDQVGFNSSLKFWNIMESVAPPTPLQTLEVNAEVQIWISVVDI